MVRPWKSPVRLCAAGWDGIDRECPRYDGGWNGGARRKGTSETQFVGLRIHPPRDFSFLTPAQFVRTGTPSTTAYISPARPRRPDGFRIQFAIIEATKLKVQTSTSQANPPALIRKASHFANSLPHLNSHPLRSITSIISNGNLPQRLFPGHQAHGTTAFSPPAKAI